MAENGLQNRAQPKHRMIYGYDREISHWVAQRLGINGFGPSRAIGVELDGEIIAGVVYFNCRHNGLEMAVASTTPKWATRRTLKHFFSYPFLTQGCNRITVLVDIDDHGTRRFDERLGFVQEGILREAHPNGDAVVYGMLKDECRWI